MLRRVIVRWRVDGLREVARVGRLRHMLAVVVCVLLAVPAALLTMVALVAVLPLVVLAVPGAVAVMVATAIWLMLGHRGALRHPDARVLRLPR